MFRLSFLHEHRSDGIVDVTVSSSTQKLPETHLRLLCRRNTVHRENKNNYLINLFIYIFQVFSEIFKKVCFLNSFYSSLAAEHKASVGSLMLRSVRLNTCCCPSAAGWPTEREQSAPCVEAPRYWPAARHPPSSWRHPAGHGSLRRESYTNISAELCLTQYEL